MLVYLGPFPTATEDRELVAQHNDLELPLITLADEQAKKAAEEPVQQRHQHDAQSEPTPTRSPAGPSWPNPISLPHTLEHPELLTEQQNLDLLLSLRATPEHEQLEESPQRPVQQRDRNPL